MAIQAKFEADFSTFQKAVADATVSLKGFEAGTGKVESSLNRMVDSFSGRKIITEATMMSEAVDRVGGISRLTEAELARVGRTAQEAAEKFRAWGQDVPPKIQAIADTVKGASDATSGWIPILQSLGSSWVARIAEGILLRDAIHLVIDKVKEMALALPELALKGAAVADVEENFKRLASQAGLTGDTLMGALRTGTHATITDFELMKTVNQDLAAGLNLTDKQFGTLAKGAFALAQATGGDVKTALDTMNDAMLTGRTRSLALLTGKIDVSAAEERYAKTLGVSRDALSEAGKLEAARAEILRSVGAATERLGEQTDGLDERVAQASVAWENFQENLGKTLATSAVLETGLAGVKAIIIETFGGTQETAIKAIASAVDTITIAMVDVGKVGVDAAGFVAKEWFAAKKVFGDLTQILGGVTLSYLYLNKAAAWSTDVLGKNKQVQADIQAIDTQIQSLLITMRDRGVALQADDRAQQNVDKSTSAWKATLDGLRDKMVEAASGARAFVGPINEIGKATNTHAESLTKAAKSSHVMADALREYASVGENVRATVLAMDSATVEGIKWDLARGQQQSVLQKIYGVTAEQIHAIIAVDKENQKSLDETIKRIDAFGKIGEQGAAAVVKGMQGMKFVLRDLAVQMGDVELAASKAFSGIGPLMGDASVQARKHMFEIDQAVVTVGDHVRATFGKIPELLTQAFTGGGGLAGAIKAIGVQFAEAILVPIEAGLSKAQKAAIGFGTAASAAVGQASGLGTTTQMVLGVGTGLAGAAVAASAWGVSMAGAGVAGSVALGAATLGIGTAAVGVALLIKHWWDHRKAVQESTKEIDAFQQQIWATLTPAQAMEAGGREWAASVIGVRDAYLATGRSAAQAEIDVKKLWDSAQLGAAATTAAMATINQAFIEQKQDADDLAAAIHTYGFSIEELGPTMQRQQLDAQAKTLLNDWRLLVGSGIDLTTVNTHMTEKMSEYLATALKTGTEVPAAMKPILQSMIDQGTLTDAAGNKIEDLSGLGITFSETMTQGFDRIVAKLSELLNKIGMVPETIQTIAAVTRNTTGQMIRDWAGVEDAVDHVNFGRSPSGLDGLISKIDEAGNVTNANTAGMMRAFGGVESAVDDVGIHTTAMIDNISGQTKTLVDGQLRTVKRLADGTDVFMVAVIDHVGTAIAQTTSTVSRGMDDLGIHFTAIIDHVGGDTRTMVEDQLRNVKRLADGTDLYMIAVIDHVGTEIDRTVQTVGAGLKDLLDKMKSVPGISLGTMDEGPFKGYATAPTLISEAAAIARVQAVAQQYSGRQLNSAEISALGQKYGYGGSGQVSSDRLEAFLKQLVSDYLTGQFKGFAEGGVVPQYFGMGGNVLRWKARGTDTVPAMLTPGERVLTKKQNAAYEASGSADVVAELQGMRAENRQLREQFRNLPKMIRDALLLMPRAS